MVAAQRRLVARKHRGRGCGNAYFARQAILRQRSTLVTWFQHRVFRSWIDPLTIVFFPVRKRIAVALSPWRDSLTIFVLARTRCAG